MLLLARCATFWLRLRTIPLVGQSLKKRGSNSQKNQYNKQSKARPGCAGTSGSRSWARLVQRKTPGWNPLRTRSWGSKKFIRRRGTSGPRRLFQFSNELSNEALCHCRLGRVGSKNRLRQRLPKLRCPASAERIPVITFLPVL